MYGSGRAPASDNLQRLVFEFGDSKLEHISHHEWTALSTGSVLEFSVIAHEKKPSTNITGTLRIRDVNQTENTDDLPLMWIFVRIRDTVGSITILLLYFTRAFASASADSRKDAFVRRLRWFLECKT